MSGTRRKPGRLGPFVEGYRVWLLEAGYTPQTVRWMLRDLGRLGRWMDAEDVQIGALTVTGVESWLAARRAADGYRVPTVRALRALLSFLGEVGVMGEEEPPALSPVEALVDGYRHWLIADRGLAAEIEIPQVRQAAETFASSLFPRGTKLLRTEPLKAMVSGAFVRGLSMRDVESLCEKAGLGRLPKSTVSKICRELRERFEQFNRRDLYDIRLVALFLDATFLAVRPDGPKEGVLIGWGFTEEGERVLLQSCSGCASPTRTGRRSGAI